VSVSTQPGQGTLTAQADCAANQVATGGGYEVIGGNTNTSLVTWKNTAVVTNSKPTGWIVTINYGGSGNNKVTLSVYVLCAPAS
jgi:hypothetical protein